MILDEATIAKAADEGRRRRAETLNLVILLGTVVAVVLMLLSFRRTVDDDLWLHLRIGDEIRDGERFGGADPLTVLADRPYVPSQWLAEVIASISYDLTGLAGIHVLRLVAVSLVAVAIYSTSRSLIPPVKAAVVTLPALFATSAAWAERPQLVGLGLHALALLIWLRAWRDGTVPWLIVPITWLWACIHGTWAVGIATGLVMTVAIALDRRHRPRRTRLLMVTLASMVAVGSTPLGPALLLEPLSVSTAARQSVNEWQPPSLTNPLLLVVVAMGLISILALVRRRVLTWASVALLALGAGLAVYSVRTIAFGAVLMGSALAAALFVGKAAPGARSHPENWLWPITTTVIVLGGLIWGSPEPEITDASLRSHIDRLPAGTKIAVQPDVSGWVLFHQPELRPLRDLRAEVYSATAVDTFEHIWSADVGWERRLAALDVHVVLVRSADPLARALPESALRRVAVGNDYELWVDATWTGAATV
ncbi:hypothetical protein [Intrasporangium sp. DVR]|uniref:hypothetical protein n=1 Tax=Intrasporangium sp. DVR TaxID=3127867 RepID=UPI00333F633F